MIPIVEIIRTINLTKNQPPTAPFLFRPVGTPCSSFNGMGVGQWFYQDGWWQRRTIELVVKNKRAYRPKSPSHKDQFLALKSLTGFFPAFSAENWLPGANGSSKKSHYESQDVKYFIHIWTLITVMKTIIHHQSLIGRNQINSPTFGQLCVKPSILKFTRVANILSVTVGTRHASLWHILVDTWEWWAVLCLRVHVEYFTSVGALMRRSLCVMGWEELFTRHRWGVYKQGTETPISLGI